MFNGPSQIVSGILTDVRTGMFRDREVITHYVEIPLHRVDAVRISHPLWKTTLDDVAGACQVRVRMLEIVDGVNHERRPMKYQRLEMTGPRKGCDTLDSEIEVCHSLPFSAFFVKLSISSPMQHRILMTKYNQRTFRVPKWVPKDDVEKAIIEIEGLQTAVSIGDSNFFTLSCKDPINLLRGERILQAAVDAAAMFGQLVRAPPSFLSVRDTNRMTPFGRKG